MKKKSTKPLRSGRPGGDDILPEYDFSRGARNKYARDTLPEAPWWSWSPT
jgi:hypothetical protein